MVLPYRLRMAMYPRAEAGEVVDEDGKQVVVTLREKL